MIWKKIHKTLKDIGILMGIIEPPISDEVALKYIEELTKHGFQESVERLIKAAENRAEKLDKK